MSLLGIQLPSISDIVNGFVSAVANAVNTVIQWMANAVGWLWSQIYNYIVKPISDFINWLFETAKGMILNPILGFLGNALNVIQKKAFGTLYIAVTYKLMYKEMVKLAEVKDFREGLKEAFWLVLKPMVIYLALSMFWKMIIISSPASAFGVPPALSGQFTPVPPPSVPQPSTPSAPVPWQITLYDRLDTVQYADIHIGIMMSMSDKFDTTYYADMEIYGVCTLIDIADMTYYADMILPTTFTLSDTFDAVQYAGMGTYYDATLTETEPTLVLSGGVS